MNHINKSKYLKHVVRGVDNLVSFFMLLATIAVVIYVGIEVWNLFKEVFSFSPKLALQSVALIVIFVKAYRLLMYYMLSHHVSIRYIIEISIIAPSIELIFTPENRPMELNILYAVFALVNLVLYVMYGKKLRALDKDHADEELH